jgi:Zn-dependent metalloprotease
MRRSILATALLFLLLFSSTYAILSRAAAMSPSEADDATLESIARQYLQGQVSTLGVNNQIPEIQLSKIEEAPDFYVAHFVQTNSGVRVYNTTAMVMIAKSGLKAVDGTTKLVSLGRVIDSKIDAQTALNVATGAIAGTVTSRGTPTTEKVLYVVEAPPIQDSNGNILRSNEAPTSAPQVARVCWQVNVPALEPLGDWSVLVDGPTGEVISKQNLIMYDTGDGWVYRYSNPIQTGGNSAIPQTWPPPDDLDYDTLTAQETNNAPPNNWPAVQLFDLNSGTGKLSGAFVDLTAPGITPSGYGVDAGLADEPSRSYHYTRQDNRFGEVMVYYYVDSLHRYLQQIGEQWLLNYPVPAHAHYYDEANAFYSSWDLGLHFGDGPWGWDSYGNWVANYPINTAEDGDVIIHEYGHAIHGDQGLFSGWNSEEMGAFSEGFSDYLAASFLDQGADVAHTQGCVFEWFGYEFGGSYPYCMRTTLSTKHYPQNMVGEVHADGEIWSAALWKLRTQLGKGIADRLAIEEGYYLWPSATFRDAANAMIQVDRVAYAGAHESTIRKVFRDNGILGYWVGSQAYPWSPYWSYPVNTPLADNNGFETGDFAPVWGTGDLESSYEYYDLAVDPEIVTDPVFTGTYAAHLVGSDSESGSTASSIYYEFDMPSDAQWLRLIFHYRIDTNDFMSYPDRAGDWFEWRLGTSNWWWYNAWLEDTGGSFYRYRTQIPTGPLQGQHCRLTFLLHDDGASGTATQVYLDGNGGTGSQDSIILRWSNFHAPITINGQTQDTPLHLESGQSTFWRYFPEGTAVSVSAPAKVTVGGGTSYSFMQWSDMSVNPKHPSFTPTRDIYLEADYYANSWSGWQAVPGKTTPVAPTILYDERTGVVHLFIRGSDNRLWHNMWWSSATGGWQGWDNPGGLMCNSQPTAVEDSDGNIHVVVLGASNKFWHTYLQPDGDWYDDWTTPDMIDSGFTATFPTLIATADGRIDLVVRASDSSLRHNWWSAAIWQYDDAASPWETLTGGATNNQPALAYDSSTDTMYVFIRGKDNKLWHNELTVGSGSWGSWSSINFVTGLTSILGTPSVITDQNGRLDLMVWGNGNAVWHGYSKDSMNSFAWERPPGITTTTGTPAETYRETNVGRMLEVMVRRSDGFIYHGTLDIEANTWSAWTKIPGALPSTPAVLMDSPWYDEMYLCARGSGSKIYFGTMLVWVGPMP